MDHSQDIIKLWNDGLTATQIGDQFRTTRSAILGKISRLRAKGFLIARRSLSIGKGSVKPRIVKPRKVRQTTQLSLDVFFSPMPPVISIPMPIVTPFAGGGVTLFALKRTECHYIIGREDDTHMYCGRKSLRRSMCKEHHARCYYKPKV